jgi:ribosome recycling factor
MKKLGKDGLSEDLAKGAEENVQELTNTYSSKIDVIYTAKEAEIMTV